jgi:hypothetical protein
MRRAFALATLLSAASLAGACRRGDAPARPAGSQPAPPAAVDTTVRTEGDSVRTDTVWAEGPASPTPAPRAPAPPPPLETAREVLGPEVRQAMILQPGGSTYIVAAMGLDDFVPAPRPGHHVRTYQIAFLFWYNQAEWVEQIPKLVVDDGLRGPAGGTGGWAERERELAPFWGVADADGDGEPEAFASEVMTDGRRYTLDLYVFEPDQREVSRLSVGGRLGGTGLDTTRRDYSPGTEGKAGLRRWLAAKADSLDRIWRARREETQNQ